ncbi:unnamed protein product [Darwinula stevensoni]|uniref:Ig-like domain-containing protein n=1 Tax=Darwinula stevensoni TaxID=69355 RepID=A0A7R8WXR5_9CRUS|nr:unnamed protein product [Darwinula stevensoni]CAG0878668.1 unnamed protein product [Darwinula stevensoni]
MEQASRTVTQESRVESRSVVQQRTMQYAQTVQQQQTITSATGSRSMPMVTGGGSTTFQQIQDVSYQQVQQPAMVQSPVGRIPNASPPVFEQIFKNARFAQGGNALFEGKVKGNPRPNVSWTRKGAPLMPSNKYQMKYDEQTGKVSLLISIIGPGDEGEYTCKATNQYGEAVCTVYIQPEAQYRQWLQKQETTIQHGQQERKVSESYMQSQYEKSYQTTGAVGAQYSKQDTRYANGVQEDFRVDTFEYRLLRDAEFREAKTKRLANETETETEVETESEPVTPGPLSPPQLAQKPRSSKVLEGSDATFQAKVTGNPRPKVTWFKNGIRIRPSQRYKMAVGNQIATLNIRMAMPEDSGQYTMLAENAAGRVVSSACLAVEAVGSQDEMQFKSVRSPGTVDGVSRPWEPVGVVRPVISAEPQPVNESDVSKSLAPNFVRVCGDQEVQEGKLVRFDVRISGRPYPDVAWYLNGRQVTDDATHKILVNESGGHSLMITCASRNDGGRYTCVARNKSGEIKYDFSLSVIEKEVVVAPKFVERFSTTNVREGESIILQCRAIGTPVPKLSWQKDGVVIQTSPGCIIHTEGGSSTLEISSAQEKDSAWYQCMATNTAGSAATRARVSVEVQKPASSAPWRLQLPKPQKVIEPEPELEPEVIYLRHVERTRPHAARSEDEVKPTQPPQFTLELRDATGLVEGQRADFQGKVIPIGDPTMTLEWFFNGKPIEASSRVTSTYRFGFITLTILTVSQHDVGVYTCRATNALGVAESSAKLECSSRSTIESISQHPESLEQIQRLEDYSRYQRTESVEESSSQKPVFIEPLRDLGDFLEGSYAHFEAQLKPLSDPYMRVEWYHNGKPLTASSRTSTIFNFGYVALNIMHLRPEDTGTYTVRAFNRLGEAISEAVLSVVGKGGVVSELGIPEQQRYIEKIEQLEGYKHAAYRPRQDEEQVESPPQPEFKVPLRDQIGVAENGVAHFESRLEPIGDSTLRVEWYKDGQSLEASSRMTTFFNFGFVALTIKAVSIYDVGTYTCRAVNASGEAITAAQLTVKSKSDIVQDSQHPGGLQQIQHLEDASRYGRKVMEETFIQQIPPKFLGPLKGTNKIKEGQNAHFETRLEPQNDPKMIVEWYFNGKPLMQANRIQTYHDFGYVAIDILSVRPEDSGTYTVVAKNTLGEATLSAHMEVETRTAIDTTSMHRVGYDKAKQAQQKQFQEPHYDIEEISKSKPVFIQPLHDHPPVKEGGNFHLECRLEPMGDPTMRVEWFSNGRPITVGSRFKTYFDFGYVALDVSGATEQDTGEYTVRATNHLGSAHTSSMIRIVSEKDIISETQNEAALEQIYFLEEGRPVAPQMEEVVPQGPPTYTRPLKNIEAIEGNNIHLECRLHPVGDSSMKVEWFVNGKPVRVGHRFRPSYDFDYVALDLLSVYPEDSGVYTCRAINSFGEAVTSASVKVIAKKHMILESQHPESLQQIQHLEDASRYQRREWIEEVVKIQPKFLSKMKDHLNMREGQQTHFECRLEPVADSDLKVEWFKNGKPLQVGSRFHPIHDFGYVALDIADLIAEDSGLYTCRATNLAGVDESSAQLIVKGSRQVVTDTAHQEGLEQIQYLEDREKYQRAEHEEEVTTQPPVFTSSLKNISIKEGQRAHFECRLIPVSDSTMKVQWFHNGTPVKSGSRFTESNNFGFVALDIMYAYPEDCGTYTCKATNALGEAITSCSLSVQGKRAIYTDTVHEGAMQQIRHLEDANRYIPPPPDEFVTQPPVFTQPLHNLELNENQSAHFECRLIPVGDSNLKVEWFKNGIPIQQGSRVKTLHDFGFVALDLAHVYPEDSGTYTCKATNELGTATTSATLVAHSKASLLLESQNEAALEKLRQLEDAHKYQRTEEAEVEVKSAPIFVAPLQGLCDRIEGQSAHFECRIEPYPDDSMKIEWFCNGKPLSTGHRFRTMYDFGFAALDILDVYPEDSGEYTIKATNKRGTASSSIKLNVNPRSNLILDSAHPDAVPKLKALEHKGAYVPPEEPIGPFEKPQFPRPLRAQENIAEAQPVHLEATLTPVNDATMKVEWFYNGRPIPQGHRFRTQHDFGFVALDILYAYPEDSGTYMCKATNALGEAITTCSVGVQGKKSLYLETLDADRLKKIQELEAYEQPKKEEEALILRRPEFITPLNRQLKAGHRFRTTHDFGYVALDILHSYPEDSGTYMCKATNQMGEAVNTCTINVTGRRSIYMDSQHPEGWEKIREMESMVHPALAAIEEAPITAPHFITQLQGISQLKEAQHAHFECRLEPTNDPKLRLEVYHNGKLLPTGSRYHITCDFGYVALDIMHMYPEDAGEYVIRAVNDLGEDKTSITLRIEGKSGIISDSQHPEGLDKIRELEAIDKTYRPPQEEVKTFQRPMFTSPLQSIDNVNEGMPAHLECRLIPVGDPTLKVEWFRNEKPIETSSRIQKTHDFGHVALDISYLRPEDEGVYMCRASNDLGEAVTTASIKIRSKASIQLDTQHPEGLAKIREMEEKVVLSPPEKEEVFEKPVFVTPLKGPAELVEGQHAHFEARVVPVGDPNLRLEWYVNGVQLATGSRFRTTHDFGFVTLDINSVIPEDAGVYMCKAINKAGEAITSTSIKIIARSSILGTALHPKGWEKIQLQEAEMNKVPEPYIEEAPQQPPTFVKHLESLDNLHEGQNVHLDALVEPKTDPNLRIEWFKNGVSLNIGTRIRTTLDFGVVTMDIMGVRPDDSGIYTCKATNKLGEAVSTCTLKVEGHGWLVGDTMHPEAMKFISQLEHPPEVTMKGPAEPVFESPVFITHLNNQEVREGEAAHFECKVEPHKDPTLRVEFFVNGKPIPVASRFMCKNDFGFVSLDVQHCWGDDSGIYMCKATNSKGQAMTSGSLRVISKADIYFDTQHPMGQSGLEKIQEVDAGYMAKAFRPPEAEEAPYPKPVFIVPLNPHFVLEESQPLHMECQVEPKDDPKLTIEWFFNGKTLEHASRFAMRNDFGLVTLDLTDSYQRDSGIYTCRAKNQAGEAFTSSTIVVAAKGSLIEDTQHPKGKEGLEHIQSLEESLKRVEMEIMPEEAGHPPQFTSQFENLTNLSEGEIAHFEASLTPASDQSMVVEWFFNGEPIKAGHRIRTVHAFGMVVLEILGTYVSDTGTYTCRAVNKWGKAEISVKLECVDRTQGQKPHFTTHIQDVIGLKDGDSAHYECNLVPVGDPNMKVEWFHNGQPIRHSSRMKSVADFGFVVLDIAYVQSHDSGEYMCKATNKFGEDVTKATLQCLGKGGVYGESLQPDSLEKIRKLEQMAPATKPSVTEAMEPPKFVTHLSDITRLIEGQSAHFEGRLTPVNDPNLVVEWYHNGKKLRTGHRFRTFHDFGIVILDILYCYEEDSGEYQCKAVNKLGQDVSKAFMRCVSKANLILEPQVPKEMEGGLDKIQSLEESMRSYRREKVEEAYKGTAPVFTVPLENADLREGESLHFEARLTPTDDAKLKVEWYKDDKALKASSRIRTFCDFGFVILEMSPTYPEDTGVYSCRASNDYGEAVTSGKLVCEGKRSIILESQLPKTMQKGMEKIAELEGLGREPLPISPEAEGQPPVFVTTPGDLSLNENSLAHFECQLQPINDASMKVEWFHNGKPLSQGSRIKTISDFGYVILEISGIYQRDSVFHIKLIFSQATNHHGEATVSCQLIVKGRQGIIMEPQLPKNFIGGNESIQKLEESLYKREEKVVDEETPNPPRFITEIQDLPDLQEGAPAHFDCRVEPVGDSSMRIDWFHNGHPIDAGSRIHVIDDFGFVVLDIDWTFPRDSGEYICRATNKWGSATTKAILTCKGKRDIVYESQLPSGMSAEKLKLLEEPAPTQPVAEEEPHGPPKFVKHISPLETGEGERAFFECQVEPKNDPKLRVEWYHNGKLLKAGHRFRTVYDFGYICLEILYTYSEDSGEYVCRAVNDYGEDFTKATFMCKASPSIIMQNQLPKGMKKSEYLIQMEAALKKYTDQIMLTEDDIYDSDKKQPPRFVTQIESKEDLVEFDVTKFECQLAPVGDPNMKVEWFLNGKPLPYKNRFTPIYDFGYVALHFGWVYPEDSGEYLCRATNLYGMDETKAVIKTAGKPGIIYESQLPKGMQSVKKIQEMEAAWQRAPEETEEPARTKEAPQFVLKPEPCNVIEGSWAHFNCRVTGYPRPRVMWLINGHTVMNGSRYKLTYDGMWRLDIPKTRQYDHGTVQVIAKNALGEAVASTQLDVTPRKDDYRAVLKNSPKPWYDYDLKGYQEERMDSELDRVFEERVNTNLSVVHHAEKDSGEHLMTKVVKEPETEWQKEIKRRKAGALYNSYKELEEDQISKEFRMKEQSAKEQQFAIPSQQRSLALGLATSYEARLERQTSAESTKKTTAESTKISSADESTKMTSDAQSTSITSTTVAGRTRAEQQAQFSKVPPQPSESTVHGKEVYTATQKQIQKETKADKEITRKITATETTEMEHKAKTQERYVPSNMKPAKPPMFKKKIQPCRVFEGEQARFEVEFDGDPLPQIRWFREEFPIQSSPDFQIHTFGTKSILVIREVFVEDSGIFAAIAENRGGTAKCSANLIVEEKKVRKGLAPPSFTSTVQDMTVEAGQLARFDARVSAVKPLDVYWLKNGRKISGDIHYKMVEEKDVFTLLVLETVLQDAGTYECVAINQAGEARCEAQLVVISPAKSPKTGKKPTSKKELAPPTIVQKLNNVIVQEGQAATFTCKISGQPAPKIKWMKDGKQIKQSRYFRMVSEDETYSLHVSEAFPEDEGLYKCIAENPAGQLTLAANLQVRAPEAAAEKQATLTPLKNVTVKEGQAAQFKTEVSGSPFPTIQWFREGALIPQSKDFQMLQEGNHAILLIKVTYPEDSGRFTCRATNSAGQAETSAILTVHRKAHLHHLRLLSESETAGDSKVSSQELLPLSKETGDLSLPWRSPSRERHKKQIHKQQGIPENNDSLSASVPHQSRQLSRRGEPLSSTPSELQKGDVEEPCGFFSGESGSEVFGVEESQEDTKKRTQSSEIVKKAMTPWGLQFRERDGSLDAFKKGVLEKFSGKSDKGDTYLDETFKMTKFASGTGGKAETQLRISKQIIAPKRPEQDELTSKAVQCESDSMKLEGKVGMEVSAQKLPYRHDEAKFERQMTSGKEGKIPDTRETTELYLDEVHTTIPDVQKSTSIPLLITMAESQRGRSVEHMPSGSAAVHDLVTSEHDTKKDGSRITSEPPKKAISKITVPTSSQETRLPQAEQQIMSSGPLQKSQGRLEDLDAVQLRIGGHAHKPITKSKEEVETIEKSVIQATDAAQVTIEVLEIRRNIGRESSKITLSGPVNKVHEKDVRSEVKPEEVQGMEHTPSAPLFLRRDKEPHGLVLGPKSDKKKPWEVKEDFTKIKLKRTTVDKFNGMKPKGISIKAEDELESKVREELGEQGKISPCTDILELEKVTDELHDDIDTKRYQQVKVSLKQSEVPSKAHEVKVGIYLEEEAEGKVGKKLSMTTPRRRNTDGEPLGSHVDPEVQINTQRELTPGPELTRAEIKFFHPKQPKQQERDKSMRGKQFKDTETCEKIISPKVTEAKEKQGAEIQRFPLEAMLIQEPTCGLVEREIISCISMSSKHEVTEGHMDIPQMEEKVKLGVKAPEDKKNDEEVLSKLLVAEIDTKKKLPTALELTKVQIQLPQKGKKSVAEAEEKVPNVDEEAEIKTIKEFSRDKMPKEKPMPKVDEKNMEVGKELEASPELSEVKVKAPLGKLKNRVREKIEKNVQPGEPHSETVQINIEIEKEMEAVPELVEDKTEVYDAQGKLSCQDVVMSKMKFWKGKQKVGGTPPSEDIEREIKIEKTGLTPFEHSNTKMKLSCVEEKGETCLRKQLPKDRSPYEMLTAKIHQEIAEVPQAQVEAPALDGRAGMKLMRKFPEVMKQMEITGPESIKADVMIDEHISTTLEANIEIQHVDKEWKIKPGKEHLKGDMPRKQAAIETLVAHLTEKATLEISEGEVKVPDMTEKKELKLKKTLQMEEMQEEVPASETLEAHTEIKEQVLTASEVSVAKVKVPHVEDKARHKLGKKLQAEKIMENPIAEDLETDTNIKETLFTAFEVAGAKVKAHDVEGNMELQPRKSFQRDKMPFEKPTSEAHQSGIDLEEQFPTTPSVTVTKEWVPDAEEKVKLKLQRKPKRKSSKEAKEDQNSALIALEVDTEVLEEVSTPKVFEAELKIPCVADKSKPQLRKKLKKVKMLVEKPAPDICEAHEEIRGVPIVTGIDAMEGKVLAVEMTAGLKMTNKLKTKDIPREALAHASHEPDIKEQVSTCEVCEAEVEVPEAATTAKPMLPQEPEKAKKPGKIFATESVHDEIEIQEQTLTPELTETTIKAPGLTEANLKFPFVRKKADTQVKHKFLKEKIPVEKCAPEAYDGEAEIREQVPSPSEVYNARMKVPNVAGVTEMKLRAELPMDKKPMETLAPDAETTKEALTVSEVAGHSVKAPGLVVELMPRKKSLEDKKQGGRFAPETVLEEIEIQKQPFLTASDFIEVDVKAPRKEKQVDVEFDRKLPKCKMPEEKPAAKTVERECEIVKDKPSTSKGNKLQVNVHDMKKKKELKFEGKLDKQTKLGEEADQKPVEVDSDEKEKVPYVSEVVKAKTKICDLKETASIKLREVLHEDEQQGGKIGIEAIQECTDVEEQIQNVSEMTEAKNKIDYGESQTSISGIKNVSEDKQQLQKLSPEVFDAVIQIEGKLQTAPELAKADLKLVGVEEESDSLATNEEKHGALKQLKQLAMAPVFAIPLKPVHGYLHGKAILKCKILGQPTPNVNWFLNGKEIIPSSKVRAEFSETIAILEIIDLVQDICGIVTCQAQNSFGKAVSSVSLQLLCDDVAPKFIHSLQQMSVGSGESFIWSVEVQATPPIEFFWLHNGHPVEGDARRKVVTSGSQSHLEFQMVHPEDAGTYVCRAKNIRGMASSLASLNVSVPDGMEENHAPYFEYGLSSQRVMDGDELSFRCKVHGIPKPSIQWYHNGDPFKEHRDVNISHLPQGECELYVGEVFPEDAGEYICLAKNDLGEAVTRALLTIEAYEYVPDSEIASVTVSTSEKGLSVPETGPSGSEEDIIDASLKDVDDFDASDGDEDQDAPPKFVVLLPEKVEVKEGESLRLNCRASGNPLPTYTWYHHGEEILPSTEFMIEQIDTGETYLTLLETFPDDFGEIRCDAENIHGITSTVTSVVISEPAEAKTYKKPDWAVKLEELQKLDQGNSKNSEDTFARSVPEVRDVSMLPEFVSAPDAPSEPLDRASASSSSEMGKNPSYDFYGSIGDDSVFLSSEAEAPPDLHSFAQGSDQKIMLQDPHGLFWNSMNSYAENVLSDYLSEHRDSIHDAIAAIERHLAEIDGEIDETKEVEDPEGHFEVLESSQNPVCKLDPPGASNAQSVEEDDVKIFEEGLGCSQNERAEEEDRSHGCQSYEHHHQSPISFVVNIEAVDDDADPAKVSGESCEEELETNPFLNQNTHRIVFHPILSPIVEQKGETSTSDGSHSSSESRKTSPDIATTGMLNPPSRNQSPGNDKREFKETGSADSLAEFLLLEEKCTLTELFPSSDGSDSDVTLTPEEQ